MSNLGNVDVLVHAFNIFDVVYNVLFGFLGGLFSRPTAQTVWGASDPLGAPKPTRPQADGRVHFPAPNKRKADEPDVRLGLRIAVGLRCTSINY